MSTVNILYYIEFDMLSFLFCLNPFKSTQHFHFTFMNMSSWLQQVRRANISKSQLIWCLFIYVCLAFAPPVPQPHICLTLEATLKTLLNFLRHIIQIVCMLCLLNIWTLIYKLKSAPLGTKNTNFYVYVLYIKDRLANIFSTPLTIKYVFILVIPIFLPALLKPTNFIY